jgi:CRP-like cAMP-binding protein
MKKILEKNGFTPSEISDFMSNALLIKCPKKTILLHEGDICRTFYCATKGIFRAGFTDNDGVEHTRTFFSYDTSPIILSYSSFIFQKPSISFLDTIEDGEVLTWPFDFMNNLQETSFKWLRFFKRQIDGTFALREIKELQTYTFSAEERYLAFFEQSPDLANRIPLHYIASYIGITPEALSRIRGRIAKKNKLF